MCENLPKNVQNFFIAGCLVDSTLSGYYRYQRLVSDKHTLIVINVVSCVFKDTGNTGDSSFPLHHVARFRCARVACIFSQLLVQSARVGLSESRSRPCRGSLQRWNRPFWNVLPCRHLPSTGKRTDCFYVMPYLLDKFAYVNI